MLNRWILVFVVLLSSLTSSPKGLAATPVATPAGDGLILYQGALPEGEGDGIYTMNADGSDRRLLVGSEASPAYHPDWSPDGQQIVDMHISNDGAAQTLWIMNVDGTEQREIFACDDSCFMADYPAWSPDGTKIAFTGLSQPVPDGPPNGSAILILNLETGTVSEAIRFTLPFIADMARWSPDSRSLVFTLEEFGEDYADVGSVIATVPATGGEMLTLTDPALFAYYPDWNLETGEIVFCVAALQFSNEPPAGSWNLFTVQPDGTGLMQITDVDPGKFIWQPSWTPDGTTVIATMDHPTGRNAVWVDPETGEISFLVDLYHQSHPRLQPAS